MTLNKKINSQLPQVLIIGNGITGITVARYLRKYIKDLPIKIISKESKYFIARTALMYVYMGHIQYKDLEPYERWFWEKNQLELIHKEVIDIDFYNKYIFYNDNTNDKYDILILAVGSEVNKLNWPGIHLKRVQGLYSLQDLQSLEEYSKQGINQAVIVGGGLIGIELAEMLHSKKIPVIFLVRESSFLNHIFPEEESHLINQEIIKHSIDLRLSTELKEIIGNSNDEVYKIKTNRDEEIPCDFVGITTGVRPNIEFLKKTPIKLNKGIMVNRYFETNFQDVYAAGDCAEFTETHLYDPPIEQLWYTGKLQGMRLAGNLIQTISQQLNIKIPKGIEPEFEEKYLVKKEAYYRGIWFNSAKFFTIEFQTYGFVSNQPIHTFIWEEPKKNILFRIVWEENGKGHTRITGFNLFNLRFRHEVCEDWIRNEKPIEYVIEHLQKAHFNPEFYKNYTKMIQTKFKENYSRGLK